jgi:hypothetical protein
VEAAIRPWRTATLVASAIALLELAALVVAVLALVSGPLARGVRHHAAAQATAAAKQAPKAVLVKRVIHAPAVARLSRARTRVLVLNGNGRQGAASAEATTLQTLGYPVSGARNAPRTDYATTMVMYRPGYRPEALRLARDAGIRVVGPLDGLRTSDLKGSKLAVLLGK